MTNSATMVLTLRNRRGEVARLAHALETFAQDHRIPDSYLQAMTLALDELITNAIAHGYEDEAEHQIIVRLSLMGGSLQAEVEDDGKPFNPLMAPEPDLTSPIEERPVGGLGIHLVRSVMDQVDYRRESGKNRLTMTKRIG